MAGRRTAFVNAKKALLSAVMLFQFAAMVLLSLKTSPPDSQALWLSLAMPAATWTSVTLAKRFFGLDEVLLTLVLFLCSVSVVTLQGIARAAITPREQALYMLGGLAAMFAAIAFLRALRAWEKWFWPLTVGSVLFLLSPLVIGQVKYGAKNWLSLLGVSVQPSELVKIALLLILSIGLSQRGRRLPTLCALAVSAACCALLLLERDLGALLIYFLTTLALYFAATSDLTLTLAGLGAGAGGAYLAYRLLPYVQTRVATFVNPWAHPQNAGYQIIQALIAIGSGGLFGMGLGLGFPRDIPLYHSDFIFAAICEEFGYVFALALLGIYALIVSRCVHAAMNARSGFHALIAFGYAAMLSVQTLLIVGGNTKLLPLTGVTLPFVAAGGSSLLSCFLGLGLVLGITSLNARYDEDDKARALRRREGGEDA